MVGRCYAHTKPCTHQKNKFTNLRSSEFFFFENGWQIVWTWLPPSKKSPRARYVCIWMAKENVFSYYRMCSLTIECAKEPYHMAKETLYIDFYIYNRMWSLTIECALLLSNVLSYYRMCSVTIECVLLLSNVFSSPPLSSTSWISTRRSFATIPNSSQNTT